MTSNFIRTKIYSVENMQCHNFYKEFYAILRGTSHPSVKINFLTM